jgi:NADH dehydrogenase [ubiquinone] 1 alpha subcomplex assembly factor 7
MAAAAPSSTDVAAVLRRRIAQTGPIPLVDVMALVADAYYGRGAAFGRDGDFITAPEISQVFGELIGLWCAVVWENMGRPAPLQLIECGPGRGTLMADLLRATARVPGFAAAARVHLVERSHVLRDQQRARLGGIAISWHDSVARVPAGPAVVIANEFVDALPIRQFVRTPKGWAERHVGWDGGAFVFVDRETETPDNAPAAEPGDIFEQGPAAQAWMHATAARVTRDGGAVLVIDYGHGASAVGDTLQAVKQHRFHPVLHDLGSADLTAHVDFAALAATARNAGAAVLGPVAQGTWLSRLGLNVRTAQLTRGKPEAQARDIANATRRLVAPDGMGLLFKVMAVVHPELAQVPGF